MTPAAAAGPRPVDVLLVSLAATLGLRTADDQLAGDLRAAGLEVEVARVPPQREVRTMVLTDLVQARAARAATLTALEQVEPRAIVYSTTTAALLWPRPGAIRFDALAHATRPGRHGLWQRAAERRRLSQSPLLLPWDAASLDGAPPSALARPRLVLPVAIDVSDHGAGGAGDSTVPEPEFPNREDLTAEAALSPESPRPVAVTYAADAVKKGLDRVLMAWALVRKPGELLLVTGRDELPAGMGPTEGVQCVGRLTPHEFRNAVRAAGVLVLAPRREDYGLVQLEALTEGARVVTTTAPGPYAALPVIRALWPDLVVDDPDDRPALAAALRAAIDRPRDPDDAHRAEAAVAPWARATVRDQVARDVVPLLLGR